MTAHPPSVIQKLSLRLTGEACRMPCESLRSLCDRANAFSDSKELGRFVADEMLRLTGSSYSMISFFDAYTSRLVVEVSKGFDAKIPPTKPGHGPLGIAMDSRGLVVGEYGDFPHVLPSLSQEIGPVMAVPMLFRNQLFGALGVGRKRGAPAYSTQEQERFNRLSCTVTPMFLHLRSLSRNRLRNKRILAISRLIGRISNRDRESLMDEALLHGVRLFRARGGAVFSMKEGGLSVVRALNMKRVPTEEMIKKGVSAQVIGERRGVRLREYMEHPRAIREFCEENDIGPLMIEPLFSTKREILGTMGIFRRRGEAHFTAEDGAEFSLFAHHVGIALDQVKLVEELRRHAKAREVVFESIQGMLSEREVDSHHVVASLVGRALDLLEADFCGYHVWVPSQGLLKPYYQEGFDFKLPPMRMGEGLAGMALERKDVVMVTSYENEVTHNGARRKYGALVRSAISVPLIYRGEVLGTVSLGRGPEKPSFEEKEMEILRMFGAVAASVLGYTRAFEEDKKKTEMLSRIQRLESLGALGVGIAHDFNNVLTGILGYLEMAKDELDAVHPAVFGIEGAMNLVERATDLSRQILSVAGRGGGEETIFRPDSLLKELVKMAKSTFPKNVIIRLNMPRSIPAIKADPTKFHQVVLNLMVNARDAMPNGGELGLSVQERFIGEEDSLSHPELKPGRYLVVSVSDTGEGIPEDELDSIFEPGFTTKKDGTGWGLFTVFSIVKELGGTVTVYSEVGVGSTFRVYLPVAGVGDVADRKEAVLSPEEGPKKARNLLLIDDEEGLLENTRILLEKLGYRVATASSGEKGLSIYREHWQKIDGVILDMVMPGINGLEVFIAMKQVNPEVNVLLVSGHARNELIEKAIRLGARGILVKPYTSSELSKTIEEVLFK